jgi:hypothetical protein
VTNPATGGLHKFVTYANAADVDEVVKVSLIGARWTT